jgi:apolipoprotein N-acyltransferase
MLPYRKGSLAARVRAGEVPPDPGGEIPSGEGRMGLPSREPKWLGWASARICFLFVALLHTVAFPPFNVPEVAFLCLVPVFLYALRQPRWIEFLVVTFSAFVVSWLVLLEWLRHVTIGGTIAVAIVMALFPTAWCALVRWALPRAPWSDMLMRLVAVAGLAGAWVLLEWVRGWFLTGFPWLPLAASMWQRPLMLQSAAVGGAWVVSFAIVFFNLALGSYLQRLWLWVKERRGRFCPEFYLAIVVLFGGTFGVFVNERGGPPREAWFRAGFMQPYIPQVLKWNRDEAPGIFAIISRLTQTLAKKDPDVILWPEAVMPEALLWNPDMNRWVEEQAAAAQAPILFGALAFEADPGTDPKAAEGTWSNGIFLAEPDTGLREQFYRKQHRVPFGEYVPLRKVLPFIQKFVPIGGDIEAGTDPSPLLVSTPAGAMLVGPLICYEDVFPSLSRSAVAAGADLLFVATNDAWYGETGAAYQHAAHSVLRAVETRRNVLRNGNGGWSGWIDEFGFIRHVVKNKEGSVYVRGNDTVDVTRSPTWIGRQSYYVQHGDWFVVVSAALVGAMVLLLRSKLFRFDAAAVSSVRVGTVRPVPRNPGETE